MPPHFQIKDFDLQLIKAGESYITNVLRSPAGEEQGTFALPFEPGELGQLFQSLGHTRKSTRGANTPEAQNARKVGARLFEAVIAGRIRDVYLRSVGSLGRESGLRIRLRLTGVPELVDLPWELLFDASRGRFLLSEGRNTLVRHLPVAEQVEPLLVALPLRILVAISNPATREYPSLDVKQEWANLEQALQPLIERKMVLLQKREGMTQESLRAALRNEGCHVLHFVGHGGYEPGSGTGYLALEDGRGGVARVSAERLTGLLRECATLRLVVLNACEGGRTSPTDPFAGVAQALVQGAIPAVVAMQFPITDAAAVKFAGEFYKGLAGGQPVDLALSGARHEVDLAGAEGDIEWATPVLYMRGEGDLFSVADEGASDQVMDRPVPEPVVTNNSGDAGGSPQPAKQPEQPAVGVGGDSSDHELRAKRRLQIIVAFLGLIILVLAIVFNPMKTDPPQTLPEVKPVPAAQEKFATTPKGETRGHKVGETIRDCPDCPDMVVLPAGSFDMGANNGDSGEKPVHRVTIVYAFALGKTEITRGQFAAFVNETSYNAGDKCWTFEDGKVEERSGRNWRNPGYRQDDNHPVACLNWNDVKAYSEWLSKKTGKPYRLPSEAEWEYACRGGAQQEYCGSDNVDSVAWYGYEKSSKTTHPVAGKQANAFGLYDMSGNVWEWVEDSYHDSYSDAPKDGTAWGGDGAKRVLRGGSWGNGPQFARAARRFRYEPALRYISFGFRLARMLP